MAQGFESSSARWADIRMDKETEHAAALAAVDFLKRVRTAAESAAAAPSPEAEYLSVDFDEFDVAHLDFVIATLATGEVRIVLRGGEVKIEETQITGLWRVQEGEKQRFVLACVPQSVLEAARLGRSELTVPAEVPEGVFAAPAILKELAAALASGDAAALNFRAAHMIELTRQPIEKIDMQWINTLLGTGEIEIWLSGFANAHIRSTGYRGIWRSALMNRAGKGLLDSFVVSLLPPEVPASPDEFSDTARQCEELLEWLEDDLARGTL